MTANKLADALAEWVQHGAPTESCNVIVEADVPRLKVKPTRGSNLSSVRIVGDSAERVKGLERLHRFLESEVGVETFPLNAAAAFSVVATPEQLARIAESSLVRSIRPNRLLRPGKARS